MLTTKLKNIANAIRNKTQTSVAMTLDEMPSKIESIETASKPNLQDKEVTPTKQTQVVNYDEEYDGLNQVTVNPIPNEYIIPDGTLEVAQNGDVDVTNFKMARVGVYTPPNLQDKTVEITDNGTQTIKADSGYDGLNEVEVITNVASSSGGEPPALGMVLSKNNTEGFPTKLDIYGAMVFPSSSFAGTNNILSQHLEEIDIHGYGVDVGQYCFRNNKALKRVNASAGGLLVGTYLFDGCTALESVTMLERGTIYNYMFNNCTSLKEVNIASSKMTAINDYAFSGCSALETLDIPNGVKTIRPYAFNNCTSLKIKTIPDSVTDLFGGAFYQCSSLTQLSANGVTRVLGDSAVQGCFTSCDNLKAVWLNSARTMGMFAFYGCSNLKRIFVNTPRANLHTYHTSFWSNNTVHADCQVICNDDDGFMTKEEFDAIDWSTYTE